MTRSTEYQATRLQKEKAHAFLRHSHQATASVSAHQPLSTRPSSLGFKLTEAQMGHSRDHLVFSKTLSFYPSQWCIPVHPPSSQTQSPHPVCSLSVR